MSAECRAKHAEESAKAQTNKTPKQQEVAEQECSTSLILGGRVGGRAAQIIGVVAKGKKICSVRTVVVPAKAGR